MIFIKHSVCFGGEGSRGPRALGEQARGPARRAQRVARAARDLGQAARHVPGAWAHLRGVPPSPRATYGVLYNPRTIKWCFI